MKIERINENSIRCTLSGFDLSIRNLNLRELAYGSEKARKLFGEMMQKASAEVDFHAENTPIMIEAIPLNGDSIQLVITKVEDPEELDTRFSRFSPVPKGAAASEDWVKRLTSELLEGADGILRQIREMGQSGSADGAPQKVIGQQDSRAAEPSAAEPVFRAFSFGQLDRVIDAARAAVSFSGTSVLYRKPDHGDYVLALEGTGPEDGPFASVCNTIAEYGRKIPTNAASPAYFAEHYDTIVASQALAKLGSI